MAKSVTSVVARGLLQITSRRPVAVNPLFGVPERFTSARRSAWRALRPGSENRAANAERDIATDAAREDNVHSRTGCAQATGQSRASAPGVDVASAPGVEGRARQ